MFKNKRPHSLARGFSRRGGIIIFILTYIRTPWCALFPCAQEPGNLSARLYEEYTALLMIIREGYGCTDPVADLGVLPIDIPGPGLDMDAEPDEQAEEFPKCFAFASRAVQEAHAQSWHRTIERVTGLMYVSVAVNRAIRFRISNPDASGALPVRRSC